MYVCTKFVCRKRTQTREQARTSRSSEPPDLDPPTNITPTNIA